MNRGGPRVAAITALALGGCAAAAWATRRGSCTGFALPSYQILEECYALKAGDRLEYRFESDEPVDFNLHYHEGGAVVMPVSREKSVEAPACTRCRSPRIIASCGRPARGAVIDYRLRVRPPDS